MGDQLSVKQLDDLQGVLESYNSVFDTSLVEHRIDTGGEGPIRLPPYRLPQAFQESVQREIEEMQEHDIIEPSMSDWASPVVLVKKKDQTLRLCVDYRKINKISKKVLHLCMLEWILLDL